MNEAEDMFKELAENYVLAESSRQFKDIVPPSAHARMRTQARGLVEDIQSAHRIEGSVDFFERVVYDMLLSNQNFLIACHVEMWDAVQVYCLLVEVLKDTLVQAGRLRSDTSNPIFRVVANILLLMETMQDEFEAKLAACDHFFTHVTPNEERRDLVGQNQESLMSTYELYPFAHQLILITDPVEGETKYQRHDEE